MKESPRGDFLFFSFLYVKKDKYIAAPAAVRDTGWNTPGVKVKSFFFLSLWFALPAADVVVDYIFTVQTARKLRLQLQLAMLHGVSGHLCLSSLLASSSANKASNPHLGSWAKCLAVPEDKAQAKRPPRGCSQG